MFQVRSVFKVNLTFFYKKKIILLTSGSSTYSGQTSSRLYKTQANYYYTKATLQKILINAGRSVMKPQR